MTSPTHSYGVGINEEDTLGTIVDFRVAMF